MKEIGQHKIKIYDFPESTGEEGEGADASKALRGRVPFAVVGANTVIEQDGRRIRGRKYPWGIAEGIINLQLHHVWFYRNPRMCNGQVLKWLQ